MRQCNLSKTEKLSASPKNARLEAEFAFCEAQLGLSPAVRSKTK